MSRPDTKYVAVGDADVAYQVLGEGPSDLLFFNGLGSHVEMAWENSDIADFLKQLASLRRLISFSIDEAQGHLTVDRHDQIVREQLRIFRGREVNTTGDGFVASFDGPARAIRCGQAIIDATRAHGIELRVGLHTGECEVRGNDLGGLAVHIAARLGSLAVPDEVLVSGTVKDLVVGSGIEFQDRGEHELKGVPGSWRLFRVDN